MTGLVLGFGAELAKETGAWLDRLLPAPRLRRTLREWRRSRPFWAGVWTALGGAEMIFLPLAPLPLMLKVGIGAMSAIGVGLVLIAGGLFFVFAPAQRMFVSVVTAIASLVSLATTNLGGFGIGVGLGLFGSSMAFGWLPDAPRTTAVPRTGAAADTDGGAGPDDRSGTDDRARPGRGPAPEAEARPVGGSAPDGSPTDDGKVSVRPTAPGGGVLRSVLPPTLALLLAAGALAGLPGTGRAAEGGPAAQGGASAGADAALPCLTGVDTGGVDQPPPTGEPPSRTATPGEIGDPGDLTPLRPPLVVGGQPGPGRADYPVSPYHPTVRATRLAATGAIIHGATYLPTLGGGRIKVLWVHADRIVADDYHFEVKGPDGTTHVLDVQLDIRNVDVYATRLQGAVEIPFLKVTTPEICLGADIVPADLPVAVQLPELTLRPVTAGQVLVDAADVRFTALDTRPQHP